jgi:uncharacterized protein involved in outer membrane biogenesis
MKAAANSIQQKGRRWLVITSLVIGGLGLTIISLPNWLPSSVFAELCSKALYESTGLTMRVEGKGSFELMPDLAITLPSVSIWRDTEATDLLLRADKAEMHLAIWPLLRSELVIRQFDFVTPDIYLHTDKAATLPIWWHPHAPSEQVQIQTSENKAWKFTQIDTLYVRHANIHYPGVTPIAFDLYIDFNNKTADKTANILAKIHPAGVAQPIKISGFMQTTHPALEGKTGYVFSPIEIAWQHGQLKGQAVWQQQADTIAPLKLTLALSQHGDKAAIEPYAVAAILKLLKKLPLTLALRTDKTQLGPYYIEKGLTQWTLKDQVVTMKIKALKALGGAVTGRLVAHLAGEQPLYNLELQGESLLAQNILAPWEPTVALEGPLHINAVLSATGIRWEDIVRNVSGKLTIKGEDVGIRNLGHLISKQYLVAKIALQGLIPIKRLLLPLHLQHGNITSSNGIIDSTMLQAKFKLDYQVESKLFDSQLLIDGFTYAKLITGLENPTIDMRMKGMVPDIKVTYELSGHMLP